MMDKALVIRTGQDGLARVKIQAAQACRGCSAHHLCSGLKKEGDLFVVRNPLNANPGDEVFVEIPEAHYNRALIILFGTLLLALLSGAGIGYLLSLAVQISSAATSALGSLSALILAGSFLFRHLKKMSKSSLYPVIIEITNKGVDHG